MKMTSKNSKKYNVNINLEAYAMLRSGHHAILHWIFENISDPIYFRNDILGHGKPRVFRDRGKWIPIGHEHKGRMIPWYIYNIEDSLIEGVVNRRIRYNRIFKSIRPKKRLRILVLRDPFNLFASRLKFLNNLNKDRAKIGKGKISNRVQTNGNSGVGFIDNRAIDRWCEYAREFLGETSHLEGCINIRYRSWVKSNKYRKKIAKRIGIGTADKGLLFVPKNGGGSSFDKLKFNNDAQKMDVFNRWELFFRRKRPAVHEKYLDMIMKNEELIRLSKEIYPGLTARVLERYEDGKNV